MDAHVPSRGPGDGPPTSAGDDGDGAGDGGERWRAETRAVVSGRDPTPGAPLNVPPVLASTFRDGDAPWYGRWGNPTWEALEAALGAMEGGTAVTFSSGQAATAAVLDGLPTGAVVVHPTGAYAGTRELLGVLADAGRVRLRPVDVTDTGAVLDALEGAAMVWVESPTNPLLGIAEVPRIVDAATARGVVSVVDNTFATPIAQQPLAWGATLVVHSATKYIGGHSDLLLGAVVARDRAHRDVLVRHRTLHGSIPGTLDAFLALRGLRTLPVRHARQQETAGALAERLARHRAVTAVRYPGLVSDPHHARAAAQMSGFGAMVSFELPSAAAADALVGALELAVPTTSLGGVETTIERRSRWPGEEGVPPGLLRLSVGLEHLEDLWDDLRRGLEAAGSA
ncbi:MAG TPA: PLP-dependent transferase [Acidimicrobiales bacterium]|nr:PLP-dependent transferase [Acidimicrobiales bacterium]